jgi:hypothetical protein
LSAAIANSTHSRGGIEPSSRKLILGKLILGKLILGKLILGMSFIAMARSFRG